MNWITVIFGKIFLGEIIPTKKQRRLMSQMRKENPTLEYQKLRIYASYNSSDKRTAYYYEFRVDGYPLFTVYFNRKFIFQYMEMTDHNKETFNTRNFTPFMKLLERKAAEMQQEKLEKIIQQKSEASILFESYLKMAD
jgi:hypothetical protein